MSEDVIKRLIATGKTTQGEVDEARVKVDKTLQACAFSLHTLMCNREHEENPEMLLQPRIKGCNWYIEDTLECEWDAPDHSFWLGRTLEVMREQEITESEAMREFLERFAKVTSEVRDLIAEYPKAFELLEYMFKV